MGTFVKVEDGKVVEFRELDKGSPAHKVAEDGGPILRPLIDDGPPEFDSSAFSLERQYVVGKEAVTLEYTLVPIDPREEKLRTIASINDLRKELLLPAVTEKEFDEYHASR